MVFFLSKLCVTWNKKKKISQFNQFHCFHYLQWSYSWLYSQYCFCPWVVFWTTRHLGFVWQLNKSDSLGSMYPVVSFLGTLYRFWQDTADHLYYTKWILITWKFILLFEAFNAERYHLPSSVSNIKFTLNRKHFRRKWSDVSSSISSFGRSFIKFKILCACWVCLQIYVTPQHLLMLMAPSQPKMHGVVDIQSVY